MSFLRVVPFGTIFRSYSTNEMKHLLLIGQSLVYIIAFSSLYWQIPGLYGERGILPISSYFDCDQSFHMCQGRLLIAFHRLFSLQPSLCLHLACLLGITLSFLTIVSKKMRNAIVYLTLWALYFSAYEVGGTFLWFQWDTLLLESGFLMVILASFWDGPADQISIYLIRWLACRLMFASGVVKLQSDCPTWWGLSALKHHYESQCIPTPLAWYAHYLTAWFNRLSVAKTFYIEIYLPPLFILPFESLRKFAGIPQVLFMIMIMATGNYNFFNFLYALTCMALFEVGSHAGSRKDRQHKVLYWMENILSIIIVVSITIHFVIYFGINVDISRMILDSEILFDRKEFDGVVRMVTSTLILGSIVFFASKVITVIARSPKTLSHIFHLAWVLSIGGMIFFVSMVPFATLDRSTSNQLPKELEDLHKTLNQYSLTSSYGLFRSMTGVEGRPEIILEGASRPEGPWKELEFYAKPGDLSRPPSFVLPHQPRLDWQMWFAALGAYQHNPWFISLVHHLMNNNTVVVHLIDKYPFTKERPMNFARAQLYHYEYTKPGESGWWKRRLQHEYMPVLSRNAQPIVEYLTKQRIIVKQKYSSKEGFSMVLKKIHKFIYGYDQTLFVWSVFGSACVLLFTKYWSF